ncbi:DNA repair protein RAD51 homolog 4 isoform X2 [Denticeps clupeoides]|uniref:DNA repair protein RAD51 homolog 4 isoform X2 n=1 Tax=Denticeps clupeoides TaxID=299321 RepID=UPI0010A38E42|nr:DNA repair protein RAD51 homolog 4-like isoform X2 [Denticeps clupeoides]
MTVLRVGMCPGLSHDLINALQSAGIRTVEHLVSTNIEELAQKCSFSYKIIFQALMAVRRVLLAQHTAFPVFGLDLYEELLCSTAILSTGNPSLDKLLDSGLYTGEITELSGGPGSGKTQVCFGVAVNISCRLKHGVLYIDTSGGMSAGRLLQMVQAQIPGAAEQMAALQRIHVYKALDAFSLLACLQEWRAAGLQLMSAGSSVKAVLVDSLSALFSHLVGGRQSNGMSMMMQVAGELKLLSKDFGVAVLVTNHVTRDSSGVLKSGLGHSWSHVPHNRVLLQKVERPGSHTCLRVAELTKSSRQPCHLQEELDISYSKNLNPENQPVTS